MVGPALLLALLSGPGDEAVDERPAPPPVLYADKSWTHIGDGRFSPQSNGSSDLTTESAGPSVKFTVELTDAQRATIAEAQWRSALLTGSVIGNDTGQHGNTTPTIVTLGGKEVGRITKSGLFRIVIDKTRLIDDPKKPLVFAIASGKNSADDLDDQELGTFRLVLSREPPPKPPAADDGDDPEDPPEKAAEADE